METDPLTKIRKKMPHDLIWSAPFHGNQQEFAEAAGLSKGRVSQLLDPDQPFGERAAKNLCDRMGLPKYYFDLKSEYEIVSALGLGANELELSVIPGTPESRVASTDVVIRQYNTGGSMGRGLLLQDQPGIIKEWRVSDEWLRQNVHRVTAPKNLAIVTGFGPSMQPLFNPGDPLLVDTGITRADVDGVYFFRVGDEGFVKQLQRIPTASGLVLRAKSYNTLYDPFDITDGMDFEVFARVVKVWRGEEF